MKRFFFCFFIFSFFLAKQAFPFAVEPARLEFSVPEGGGRSKNVTIDNTQSDTPLHVRIYAQDVAILPDGTTNFLAPGSTDWSCSGWLKAVPSEVDVAAGRTKSVRVSVEAPKGIKGGRYAVIFFEGGAVPSSMKGIGISLRVGVMAMVHIAGTEVFKARLANFSFTLPKDIEIGIFNDGNVLIRPEGKIKVLNSRGKRVKSLELNPSKTGILPQSLRNFIVEFDGTLPKEKYTLKAEVDFGAEYLLVGELPVDLE